MKPLSLHALEESIADQCWKVTSLVLARYDFSELSHPWQEYWCPFIDFCNKFDAFFIKSVLELAAIARVNLDVEDVGTANLIVGTLTQNNETKDLTFREACNKLIHAMQYEILFDWETKHPLDNGTNGYFETKLERFKNPKIRTTGKYQSDNWEAVIRFLPFITELKDTFGS
ncbi:MAG: hypothetical protein WBL85_00390 [Sedimentisphaerales bacterium]